MNVDEKMKVTARIVKKMNTILCAGSVENGNSACGYTCIKCHSLVSHMMFHQM